MIHSSGTLKVEASTRAHVISGDVLNRWQAELTTRAPISAPFRRPRGVETDFAASGTGNVIGFRPLAFPAGKACIVSGAALRRIEQRAALALQGRPTERSRFWSFESAAQNRPRPLARPAPRPSKHGTLASLATSTLSAAPRPDTVLGPGVSPSFVPRRRIGGR